MRCTVELLAYNNGRPCGSANKCEDGWRCIAKNADYSVAEIACFNTMHEAEQWLREAALATRIVRCPAQAARLGTTPPG